ncbi:MAG: hypothetical protein OXG97_07345, partial [Candidatus Poribacteria bacterium]|nr:hypothetical protein [Candidatus Poribacteria bacterium]
HEGRELRPGVDADVFEIKVLKRPIATLMQGDQDRHHLARMQVSGSPTGFRGAVGFRVCSKMCFIHDKKVVYFAEK